MLDTKQLEEKGFGTDQINQIIKIYEEVNIDIENIPTYISVEELRTLRQNLSNSKFSPMQENCLIEGLDCGVNIIIYANPTYSYDKMCVILNALKNGLDISSYVDMYNTSDGNDRVLDLSIIFEGLEQGLDVTKYMSPDFSYEQKIQIKKGLESKLDVDIYANPKYNADQMNSLYKSLQAGIDVSSFADEKYSYIQMELISSCLKGGNDITKYIDTNFSFEQMEQIKKGLERNVDVKIFANKNYSPIKMRTIRKILEYNNENREKLSYDIYMNDLSDKEILDIKNILKNGTIKEKQDVYKKYAHTDIER